MKKKFNRLMAIIISVCILICTPLTIYADVKYNTDEVTVYITVSDISDYTRPVHIVVPRRELTVKNFNMADYGDTLTGLTAVEGVTYLHALIQLHRELYGDENVKDKLMLTEYGYTKFFMGQSTANVMYKNGKDIFAYPNMINIKNGDEIQVCLYDEGHSQAIATFLESRIDDVAVGEELDLTLYQHYSFPRNRNPIQGAEICDENGIYVTDANGDIIKTDKDGNFNVSFANPGTYTISAMPQVDYYMSELGGQIITEWVPKEITTTVSKEVTAKIGVKNIIHDPTDLTDPTTKMNLVFWGDYSNAPTYEAESGTLAGDYYIVSADNNPLNLDLSTLHGNSAVVLNPGASITIPITCNVEGEWVVAFIGQSLNETKKGFTIQVNDSKQSKGTYEKATVNADGTLEMKDVTGLYFSYDYKLGTHTVTYTASADNDGAVLVDRLVYGENVTTFAPIGGPLFITSVDYSMLFEWDDERYDLELTPEDEDWVEQTVDNRPEGVTRPYISSQEDIIDKYTITETTTETILEKVETIIPADLFPKVNYTTPLIVINVSGDLMFVNTSVTTGTSTATIKFDTKNKDLIEEDYTCYVATYDDKDRMVELKSLSTLKDYRNSVTMSNLDFSYVKIFCWNSNMKPLCSAKLYNPSEDVETTGLDWDYTQMYDNYNTYITSPTVAK